MEERIIWDLGAQYIVTWLYGWLYKIMIALKRVHTNHHTGSFLLKSLILKIHPNSGHTLGTMVKGKKKKNG